MPFFLLFYRSEEAAAFSAHRGCCFGPQMLSGAALRNQCTTQMLQMIVLSSPCHHVSLGESRLQLCEKRNSILQAPRPATPQPVQLRSFHRTWLPPVLDRSPHHEPFEFVASCAKQQNMFTTAHCMKELEKQACLEWNKLRGIMDKTKA